MKKTISIMTISLLTATTLATASPSDQMDFSTLNQSDSHMLFGQSNQNIVTLGQDEMQKTEGEWVPNAIGSFAGALGGGYAYQASYANSRSWSWGGLFSSMGGGALAGFASPVTGVSSGITAVGFGAAGGYVSNGGWWR